MNAGASFRRDPVLPVDDEARSLARRLLRMTRVGSLATLDPRDGSPFASLTSVATDIDGSPIILVSNLSGHTRHLDADPRASLLLAATGKGDPLAHPRLSLRGGFETLDRESEAGLRARHRFLARHPKATLYADFGDFSFRRLAITGASLNGGFGRAYELAATDLLSDREAASDLAGHERDAVAHMNDDHADAVALYAAVLCGAQQGRWLLTGIDPDGLDMMSGDLVCRHVFDTPLTKGEDLRARLVALVKTARLREQAPS